MKPTILTKKARSAEDFVEEDPYELFRAEPICGVVIPSRRLRIVAGQRAYTGSVDRASLQSFDIWVPHILAITTANYTFLYGANTIPTGDEEKAFCYALPFPHIYGGGMVCPYSRGHGKAVTWESDDLLERTCVSANTFFATSFLYFDASVGPIAASNPKLHQMCCGHTTCSGYTTYGGKGDALGYMQEWSQLTQAEVLALKYTHMYGWDQVLQYCGLRTPYELKPITWFDGSRYQPGYLPNDVE